MRLANGTLATMCALCLAMAGRAQTPVAEAAPGAVPQATAAAAAPEATGSAPAAKPTYIVPAGTKVLLQLRSGINTKSAKPGDGVYLASTFPVVVGTRVMIPAGVYVQGVVDRVVRAGHVKGRSQLDMHFTSIIFPNGTVVEIPGIVNALTGRSSADGQRQRRGNHRAEWRQGPQRRQDCGDRHSDGRVSGFDRRAGRRPSPGRRNHRLGSWSSHRWACLAVHAWRRCEYRNRNAGGDGSAATADSGGRKSES